MPWVHHSIPALAETFSLHTVSDRMRRFSQFLFPFVLLAAALLRADEPGEDALPPPPDPLAGSPAPLAAAIRKYGEDVERWAWVQHEVHYDKQGKVSEERLLRFDPSQPYEQQWTLLKKNGHDATPEQVEAYRKQRLKRMKDRKTLGELLEVKSATVAAESPEAITYEVPLRRQGNDRLPPDKFQVLVLIDRARQEFISAEVKLREPLRIALIGKVKKAGALLSFTPQDPRFAPPLTGIKADGSGSILFVPVSASYDLTRTELRRVKPYSERFVVRPGKIHFLDY